MKFEQLNLLRGYACFGVVLYHYFYHFFNVFNKDGGVYLFSVGKFGVELFFILSGFLIHFSLKSNKTPLIFFVSRICRLIPTYLICLLITLLILVYVGDNYRQITAFDVITNFLIFPSWFDGVFIDGSYWTLEYEWVFYIICGLTLAVNIELGKTLFLIIIILLILCFYNIFDLSQYLLFQFDNSMILNDYAPFFLLGVSLSYRLIVNKNHSHILVLLSMVIVISSSKYPIVSSFLICIFILAMLDRLPVKRDRFSLFLASISYPLYLLHQCIGFIFINIIHSLGLHVYVSIIFTFLVLVLMAYFVHKLVEIPSINYFKKKFS